MSRLTAIFSVLITASVGAMPAAAQQELHHVPPVINADGYNPDYCQPFIEPMTFNPDFQFFAPAEVDTFGGGPDPHTGWFATYDRVRIWVSRPDYEPSYTEGDFTWGNRFDVGYMTDEDHGWLFSFTHIDGPVAFNQLPVERINVWNPNDEPNGIPDFTVDLRDGGGGGGNQQQTGQVTGYPAADRNDPITNERTYWLHDSLNVATLSSMELNKVLRVHQLHYGSWVEPFAGVRYMKFESIDQHQSYLRYDEETGLPVVTPPPVPTADLDNATIEQLISNTTNWTNQMVGGQLGLRWFKQKGHWNLSSEVRGFVFQNFQSYNFNQFIEDTYYDGAGSGTNVLYITKAERGVDRHDSEFVVGSEIRAQAAYAISRVISLRAGMEFLYMGVGVARNPNFTDNNEDVVMIGYTFGVDMNR